MKRVSTCKKTLYSFVRFFERLPNKARNESDPKLGTHTYLRHIQKKTLIFFQGITQMVASTKNVIKCAFFIMAVKNWAFSLGVKSDSI